jgi:hypothetical protein
VTGLDEKLLDQYRSLPSLGVGRRILPLVMKALAGREQYESLHQLARIGGVVLWEREFERVVDSIGI